MGIEVTFKKVASPSALRSAIKKLVAAGTLLQEGQRFKLDKAKRVELRKPPPKPTKKKATKKKPAKKSKKKATKKKKPAKKSKKKANALNSTKPKGSSFVSHHPNPKRKRKRPSR